MKYLLLFLCVLFFEYAFSQNPVDSKDREIVFQNVNVIPMNREGVLRNQSVVVKDGRITFVGDAGKAQHGRNALVIDGKGKYLMPGLAEMHAHVPPGEELEPMKEVLMLFALNGVTTIRGMLGHPKHLELRRMVRNREVMGPDYYTTGPAFSGQSVKSKEEAIQMVRQQKQAGYDYLKILMGVNREIFNAINQTAKEQGIPIVGHVPFDVGIWRAIDAGYSSIDHLDGFVEGMVPDIENYTQQEAGLFGIYVADKADRSQIPKLVSGLKAQNVWVVPTQALAERWFSPEPVDVFLNAPEMKYMDEETRQKWVESKRNFQADERYQKDKVKDYIQLRRDLIKACHDHGVDLLLGCDAPQIFNVPGFSTHHELRYLVDSGLTPYEALKTGTVNVARYLKLPEREGTIAQGARANLVLLSGNPLEDIAQTQNIEGVLVGEKWLPKALIEQELKRLEK